MTLKNPTVTRTVGFMYFWWSHGFQIRTIDGLDIFDGNCLDAAFEIICPI